jgi:predicted RNase H-like nuclease (RuvC/YqgF family)
MKRILKVNAELECRSAKEKTTGEDLEAENDKLHKTHIQLQKQNRQLQATLKEMQERYEEKCRELREFEQKQLDHSQQEHVDSDALLASQHLHHSTASASVEVEAVREGSSAPDEHVEQETLPDGNSDDEVGEVEGGENSDGNWGE